MLEFASDDPIAARALEAMYHAAPRVAAAPTARYTLERAPGGPGNGAATDATGRAAGWLASGSEGPLFGPARLEEAWAFLEWRATEDLLQEPGETVFLHAAGAVLGTRLVLIVGDSGAGKSTLVTHLLLRGHRMIGDDVVRFATRDGTFSAVGRSLKLDDNTLAGMPLLAALCAHGSTGTILAAGCYYVSPAAIRRGWEAGPARARAVLLLDAAQREGPGGVRRSSEGEAAVYVSQKVLSRATAAGVARQPDHREDVTMRLLEGLADVSAYRAVGGDPAAIAEALEREVLR